MSTVDAQADEKTDRETENRLARLDITADIITAYVGANTVAAENLPALITSVFETIDELASGAASLLTTQEPAVAIEQSLTDDAIICLEDGLPFKSLKRHLRTKYDLTPEAYREKWGLPVDYPMVAPNYAKQRSALARESGLGRRKNRA